MQRRHFLKSLSLAGAFSAVPAAFSRSAGQPGIKELKGRVHSGGKGIRGVSVSDGRNVVATDAQGRYVLPAHEGAEFVFISVPAGYAFPQEQGIARFYQPVSERTSGSFDFSLEKLTVPDERHCFVIWADTQMISR
ncbi:MAG TPA: metallophosphoesterase N-terminal domain-containing protein, partial [Chitinophagaceae bacterium]|nr:metallophosphoesterase N-terminal domain-containing protein [Chitinophagaceae bacterium]